jgi:hypothetical protein
MGGEGCLRKVSSIAQVALSGLGNNGCGWYVQVIGCDCKARQAGDVTRAVGVMCCDGQKKRVLDLANQARSR